jgi:ubiquitin-protein ligase
MAPKLRRSSRIQQLKKAASIPQKPAKSSTSTHRAATRKRSRKMPTNSLAVVAKAKITSRIPRLKKPKKPESKGEEEGPWQRFKTLEEAPKVESSSEPLRVCAHFKGENKQDHHFFKQPRQNPTRTFSSRIQKEYQFMAESLPGKFVSPPHCCEKATMIIMTNSRLRYYPKDGIFVRAYEDRIDLLRVLIIGPKDTPYGNAPILIDFFLPLSNYPNKPPQAFFHCWDTSRAFNPNLYAQGKICLSILNTWDYFDVLYNSFVSLSVNSSLNGDACA